MPLSNTVIHKICKHTGIMLHATLKITLSHIKNYPMLLFAEDFLTFLILKLNFPNRRHMEIWLTIILNFQCKNFQKIKNFNLHFSRKFKLCMHKGIFKYQNILNLKALSFGIRSDVFRKMRLYTTISCTKLKEFLFIIMIFLFIITSILASPTFSFFHHHRHVFHAAACLLL